VPPRDRDGSFLCSLTHHLRSQILLWVGQIRSGVCELNVEMQVRRVAATPIVEAA
jgi:hypothetical protein